MKIGAIFGVGRIGQVHFFNCFMNEDIEIKYVTDAIFENAQAIVKKYSLQGRTTAIRIGDVRQIYLDSS